MLDLDSLYLGIDSPCTVRLDAHVQSFRASNDRTDITSSTPYSLVTCRKRAEGVQAPTFTAAQLEQVVEV